jgi:hypothetical protein
MPNAMVVGFGQASQLLGHGAAAKTAEGMQICMADMRCRRLQMRAKL